MKNVEESWDVREERSRAVQLQGRTGGGRLLHFKERRDWWDSRLKINWWCIFQKGRRSCHNNLTSSTRNKIKKTIGILQYTIGTTRANTASYETDDPCTLKVTADQRQPWVISRLDQCRPVNNPSTASKEFRTRLRRHGTESSWTRDAAQSGKRTHRGHAGTVCAAGETDVKWTAGGLWIHLAVVIRR